MAIDISRVIQVARLARDPEDAGGGGVKLRIAWSSPKKVGNGYESKSNFADVYVPERQAEACRRNLVKGSQVVVDGELSYSEWESKDGGRRSSLGIVARNVQFIGPKVEQYIPEEASSEDIPF